MDFFIIYAFVILVDDSHVKVKHSFINNSKATAIDNEFDVKVCDANPGVANIKPKGTKV